MADAAHISEHSRDTGFGAQFEVHDKQQVEVRFNYAPRAASGVQRYQVDVYFFIPRNVGVNRTNYDRSQFYGDVTALMRLDATPLALDRLADPECRASPLRTIAEALAQLRSGGVPPLARPLALHVKLYAHLYTVGVRTEVRRLEKLLGRTRPRRGKRRDREGFLPALADALARMTSTLRAYRRIRAALWPYEHLVGRSFADAMRSADEYMSLALDERLAELATAVASDPTRFDGTGFVARATASLRAVAAEEHAYRTRYGYLALTGGAVDGGEYFTYRTSLTKKSIQQALYLNARAVTADGFARNVASAVAACLAAVWALATQVRSVSPETPSRARLLLVLFAVLGYAAKDRIKALAGDYLIKRVMRHDHAARLEGDALAAIGFGRLEVKLEEVVRFLASESVPREVLDLRLSQRTVDHAEAQTEEVIHYHKHVDVRAGHTEVVLPEGYRVRDIMRFNVRHFTVRLDDPIDQVAYFDGASMRFASAGLPKVYHINLVLRIRRESPTAEPVERVTHLRLIINKEGIVRAEKLKTVRPPAKGSV